MKALNIKIWYPYVDGEANNIGPQYDGDVSIRATGKLMKTSENFSKWPVEMRNSFAEPRPEKLN